jgi:hypothetical protein
MSELKNKLQHLVEGQIPEYLRVSYPRFALFIKEYYTFLDENRQANAVLLNSNTWSDVDLTLDLFVEEMRKQHAYDISPEVLVDQRRLIKFINQYYESKGTENAAELYFRMMYNDTATVKYPGDYVLRASDGVWSSKKTVKIDTDYTQIDSASLELAPAPLRDAATDVFSLKEKTIYLKYYRRESSGLQTYRQELGCVQVARILNNQDIFELEIDIPNTINVNDFNDALKTLAYFDTVWVTAFDDDVEYVYGFLTQQLTGYTILSGGENFRRRDTFTVEVAESALYPIPGQENNNGIVRVADVTVSDIEEYFARDYVVPGAEYAASDTTGIINDLRFISTGHRFDIVGDYFAEAYNEDDNYTTYKDFVRTFENPRRNRFSTLLVEDYFEEREGGTAYMQLNDDTGYTDFALTFLNLINGLVYNISLATVRFEVGYVYQHPGNWKNNAGFLSDVNRLQDNYYYQPYSYVIQTKNVPYESWNTLYKDSAHPAGFVVFGELLVEDEITFTPIDITSTQYVINNFVDNIQPVDTVAKHVAKPITDNFSVSENSVYNFNKVLTDTAIVDDASGLELNVQPVFSDTVISSDVLAKDIIIPNITDGVSVQDTVLVEIITIVEVAETAVIGDSPQISIGLNLSEDVNTSDNSIFFFEQSLTDVAEAEDTATRSVNLLNTDSINIGDSSEITSVLTKIETVEATDDSPINSINKILVDTVVVSEVLNIDDTFTVGDTISITDENSRSNNVVIVSQYNTEGYFECPTYASDDIVSLSDSIVVALDNYVEAVYVDIGYAGDVSTATDVVEACS